MSIKCHDNSSIFNNKLSLCKIGKENIESNLLIIGDSHAASHIDTINKALITSGISSNYISNSACPSLLFIEKKYYRQDCIKRNNDIINYLKYHRIKNIILISRWEDYFNNNFTTSLDKTLNFLINQNINIYFVLDNPYQNILPYAHLDKKFNSDKFLDKKDYVEQTNKQKFFLKSFISNNQFHIIDFTKEYCPYSDCPLMQDMKYLYYDQGHLSYFGSQLTYSSWVKIFTQINHR